MRQPLVQTFLNEQGHKNGALGPVVDNAVEQVIRRATLPQQARQRPSRQRASARIGVRALC